MDGYIGEIKCFAGDFAPANWMFCWGQILPISQNTPLFALIGTQFGGDGRSTFALPDLRGRIPVTAGNIQGLTPRAQGQLGGSEKITLNLNQIPTHNHNIINTTTVEKNITLSATATVKCNGDGVDTNSPKGNYPGMVRSSNMYSTSVNNDTMNSNTLSNVNINVQGNIAVDVNSSCSTSGDTLPHNNMQPCQVLNFIICLRGYWPPRE